MMRRGFLASILALGAAPAIVRVGSLMRLPAKPVVFTFSQGMFDPTGWSPHDIGLRNAVKDRLAQWFADRIDQMVFEELAGDSGLLVPNHLQATNGEPILLPANNLRS